ncbi:MAG: ATP-binding protein [Myxococcota bacterium]
MSTTNDQLAAFLTERTEIFRSVEDRQQIWVDDPFDTSTLHAEAREAFTSLLANVTGPEPPTSGRMLLILGDAGAGKTHLIRSFRSHVHKSRAGYLGYLQMVSGASNYARYVLSNLIDSLDQPYDHEADSRTSLTRIAGELAARAFEPHVATALRDDEDFEDQELAEQVRIGADRLLKTKYPKLDIDLLRAFLYLHRPDPRIKSRILKYLRCEDLSQNDRQRIGDIVPKTDENDPQQMIRSIGRLLAAVGDTPMSLVLCVDQLEDAFLIDRSEQPFVRAMTTLRELAEGLPTAIIVVCCLRNLYEELRPKLAGPLRDRIEKDPQPVRLRSGITAEEGKELVGERLRYLYERAGLKVNGKIDVFPFTQSFFAQQHRLSVRSLLDACREYRDRCRKAGKLVDLDLSATPPPSGRDQEQAKRVAEWERIWNDFLAESHESPPDEDEELASVLCWAISCAGAELKSSGRAIEVTQDESALSVRLKNAGAADARFHVGLCNRTPKFGWLQKQIGYHTEEARRNPNKPALVLVRNDDFPRTAMVRNALAQVVKGGGRLVIVTDADWRAVLAFREFRQKHEGAAHFDTWLQQPRISRVGAIRQILDLGPLDLAALTAEPVPVQVPARGDTPSKAERPTKSSPGKRATEPVAATRTSGQITLGNSRGLLARTITMDAAELTQHAAFLGGSGSGKTTLALSVIEQLLLDGIPAVLVDRKGDLAGYARPEALELPSEDTALEARRRLLNANVDVALFTPGHPEGRPLSISVAPEGLHELAPFDRDEAAESAALALSDMLGYRASGRDASLRAILIRALQVVASFRTAITLDVLIALIEDADPALVAAIGRLDTKLFAKLVQDLETLNLTATQLFATSGEALNIDLLFGTGVHARPGRTRLSIISTKFLRDDSQIHFWVAQMLFALLRWTTRNPRNSLQAVVLFDEADMYLPAIRQPATKAPLESLLKRARSAGLGVLLATQSPGDMDYRCRDTIRSWFLGRIKEPTALAKLKPMLNAAVGDVASKLPGQDTGEFHLARAGEVTQFSAYRSILTTEQLSDKQLLSVATNQRPRG